MERRITRHPVLEPPAHDDSDYIEFYFEGNKYRSRAGEVISSSLYAAGVDVFGYHKKDGKPQGLFCANGQCAQCLVLADGKPVKACMTEVKPGMEVRRVKGLPSLPAVDEPGEMTFPVFREVEVLIAGGGPAGIGAAIELGRLGINVLLVDDKVTLGGKLTLQTHQFFGTMEDCYAGTRGIKIPELLGQQLPNTVEIWNNSTVVAAYTDKSFGIVKEDEYILVKPRVFISAIGAREKGLAFPGNDLIGVIGAGAFQTLVNRDLIKAASRLLIIGGGNVGLIAGYHALQAGIEVKALVEGAEKCGGYRVHADKLRRLGVPIFTRHTIIRAEGKTRVERAIIAEVDDNFRPIPGTERVYDVDMVLIAVGLAPLSELAIKAKQYGITTLEAGDAKEIAEASAAIFSGRIAGRKAAIKLGHDVDVPDEWEQKIRVLAARPGAEIPLEEQDYPEMRAFPVIRCTQEIPCNPCAEVCPENAIEIPGEGILGHPKFVGNCTGCTKCVAVCPGLAISMIQRLPNGKTVVVLPWEMDAFKKGDVVNLTDASGDIIGKGRILTKAYLRDKRQLLRIEVDESIAVKVAGIRLYEPDPGRPLQEWLADEDPIVCKCERVRKSEIVAAIRAGARDMNEIKARTRAGMGACGGKTCKDLILRIFREEGISIDEVTTFITRPLTNETPLAVFVGQARDES